MTTRVFFLGSQPLLFALLSLTSLVWAGQVPGGLKALEESSEKVSDVATDASRLRTALETLEHDHAAAASELAKVGAAEAVREGLKAGLASVKGAAARGDANATGRAATALMLAVADAWDVFHPLRPTELLRLDALAVRVPLDLAAGRREDALADTGLLARAWDRLRPGLPPSSATKAAAMSREVTRLRSAVANGQDAVALTAARAVEDLVDDLEKVYPEV